MIFQRQPKVVEPIDELELEETLQHHQQDGETVVVLRSRGRGFASEGNIVVKGTVSAASLPASTSVEHGAKIIANVELVAPPFPER